MTFTYIPPFDFAALAAFGILMSLAFGAWGLLVALGKSPPMDGPVSRERGESEG